MITKRRKFFLGNTKVNDTGSESNSGHDGEVIDKTILSVIVILLAVMMVIRILIKIISVLWPPSVDY